jgi:hypothetical protein
MLHQGCTPHLYRGLLTRFEKELRLRANPAWANRHQNLTFQKTKGLN